MFYRVSVGGELFIQSRPMSIVKSDNDLTIDKLAARSNGCVARILAI